MTYPQNIATQAEARIASVEPSSPAARAGIKPGMVVTAVDGEPLRDILDWHWLTDELEVELQCQTPCLIQCQGQCQGDGSFDTSRDTSSRSSSHPREGGNPDATEGRLGHQECQMTRPLDTLHPDEDNTPPSPVSFCLRMTREPGEAWGLTFSDVLFDGLRSCVNACSFCFMRMLPEGMRPSLYVRDDDYRLSFLHGNFVTLTNVSDSDLERIVTMHLSPLNVSLHAVNSKVRRQMMGKNHARGLEVLEQLLEAGIEFKAQIVLMPGINDNEVLDHTLAWIARHPGITATGIVPYGYTRYAALQQGFDTPESARAVIRQVESLAPHVQLADEFYLKAWLGEQVIGASREALAHLPAAEYYGGYPLIEDGIGTVRQFIDSPEKDTLLARLASEEALKLVTGEAFAAVLHELWPEHQDSVIPIKNTYFGGNVDVAGLLTAEDIIKQAGPHKAKQLLLPPTLFNDDGLTLDNKTATDIAAALGVDLVSFPL